MNFISGKSSELIFDNDLHLEIVENYEYLSRFNKLFLSVVLLEIDLGATVSLAVELV